MSAEYGFVDLRLNNQAGNGEEGFWPSFTDIMTVIVMIFLMSMLVLMIRNMELVAQLRQTMAAEREAAAMARSTSEQKDSLALRLLHAENEISMLQLQLMRSQEQIDDNGKTILAKNQSLNALAEQKVQLQTEISKLNQEKDGLSQKIDLIADELRQNIANYRLQMTENKTLMTDLTQLRANYNDQNRRLNSAQNQIVEQNHLLSQAQEDYSSLKVKYDRLVRPARSARGKFVVEVRFSLLGQTKLIEYRTSNSADFAKVTLDQLHQQLTTLKNTHKDKLYIKIVFPKDSGLSYSEAWSFTNELLKQYDYYHQHKN